MSKQHDGGPAFPSNPEAYKQYNRIEQGMTLRDYFAAKAMHAYMSGPDVSGNEESRRLCAKWSYQVADAMLAARNAKEGA